MNELENKIQHLEMSLNEAFNVVSQKDFEYESLTRSFNEIRIDFNSQKVDLYLAEVVSFHFFKAFKNKIFKGKNKKFEPVPCGERVFDQ